MINAPVSMVFDKRIEGTWKKLGLYDDGPNFIQLVTNRNNRMADSSQSGLSDRQVRARSGRFNKYKNNERWLNSSIMLKLRTMLTETWGRSYNAISTPTSMDSWMLRYSKMCGEAIGEKVNNDIYEALASDWRLDNERN